MHVVPKAASVLLSEAGLLPNAERSDFSFGQLKKMRKTDDFSSVFRFRCVKTMPGLDILAAPNGLGYSRLGMIVPKKVIAHAVLRNRVKRLIREYFRLKQTELAGLDVVARIRSITDEARLKDAIQLGLEQCKTCLNTCRKANIKADKAIRL